MLLNRRLKYNLNLKRKQSLLSNLAFEAATAITWLPTWEQDYIRHQVAHNLQRLCKQQKEQPKSTNTQTTNENKIKNQIKGKLNMNKVMIPKAEQISL